MGRPALFDDCIHRSTATWLDAAGTLLLFQSQRPHSVPTYTLNGHMQHRRHDEVDGGLAAAALVATHSRGGHMYAVDIYISS